MEIKESVDRIASIVKPSEENGSNRKELKKVGNVVYK